MHCILGISLKCNPHCTLHKSTLHNCTLHTGHWKLHTANCTLHIAHCTLHNCTLHNIIIQQHRLTLSFCTYSSLYCCISFVKCAVHRIELLIALYFGYFTQMKSLVLQCIACTLSYNVLVGKLTNLRGAFPFLINLTSQPPLSKFTPNDVCLVSCHLTNRNGTISG